LLGENSFDPGGADAVFLRARFGGAGECPEVGELIAALGAQRVELGAVLLAQFREFSTQLLNGGRGLGAGLCGPRRRHVRSVADPDHRRADVARSWATLSVRGLASGGAGVCG